MPETLFTSLLDKAALDHLSQKTRVPGFSHYDVWLHEHAVAFSVAKMMNADLLQTTKNALQTALKQGESYDDFAKKLKPYLMKEGWWGEQIMRDPKDGIAKPVQLGSTRRLRIIFQTNMATAFAAGQWARIQENATDFPYLKYIASTAEKKRDSHIAFYGKIYKADDPIWQSIFPPNGYGCQCTVRQLTEKQALKERDNDIKRQPERFTAEEKANAQRGIINDTPNIRYTEFTNPRTGKTIRLPEGITPGFAHNHGDRLNNLIALYEEKHGQIAKDTLIKDLNNYLFGKVQNTLNLVDFASIKPDEREMKRFIIDPLDGKEKPEEARLAAQWQAHYGVQLKRFPKTDNKKGQKAQGTPDFVIIDPDKPQSEWQTLDFMYTLSESADQAAFLQQFNRSKEAWERSKKNIIDHTKKADIVPLYLKFFDLKTKTKLLGFVLSLPEKERKKIVLIWDQYD